MPTQVTEFKCPACTAPLHFSEETGRLECDYCGSSFTVAEAEAFSAEKEQQAAEAFEKAAAEARADAGGWERPDGQDSWGEEADHLKTYRCPSCGAELICDEATAATSCPYCGNNTIISGQFHGMQKPELVIPFKLGKEEAVKTLKAHYKGRPFLPKSFSDENHIQEIKGIYVPFWLYDADCETGIRFRATQVRTWSSKDYIYTETSHYAVFRRGSLSFEHVPVDGSTRIPNDLMESIEPFDYRDAVDFRTAYLSGFFADRYNESATDCEERANERIKNSTQAAVISTVTGYSSIVPEHVSVRMQAGKTLYALLPVWLLTTKWNGQTYTFAMNGQTGKFVGNLPLDKAAYHKWLWGLTAAVSAGIIGLSYLIHLLA